MNELFDSVRESCSPASWSRGVTLARQGNVYLEEDRGDELVLRVDTGRRLHSATVVLFPDDLDWDCDGASGEDADAAVSAAVIALKRAKESGEPLPTLGGGETGRLSYVVGHDDETLIVERVIKHAGGTTLLEIGLAKVRQGGHALPDFLVTDADLALEHALGSARHGRIGRGAATRVLEALRACDDVTVDGKPIEIALEPISEAVVIDDAGDGLRVSVGPHPDITQMLGREVAQCGNTIRPFQRAPLTGRERESLERGEHVPASRASELVTSILPTLRGRVAIVERTKKLPKVFRDKPRLRVELQRAGALLKASCTIVYGMPTRAVLRHGKILECDGPVPERDRAAENRLMQAARRTIQLVVDSTLELSPREALELVRRLEESSVEVVGEDVATLREWPALSADVRWAGERLELLFETERGNARQRASETAVLRAWAAGDDYVALEGGGWAPLPRHWLSEHGEALRDILEAREFDSGAADRSAIFDSARLLTDLGEAPPPQFEELRGLVESFEDLPELSPPADLTATLRHYQEDGVRWLSFHRDAKLGALLADDMGLGKTLQTICVLRGKCLVVAPRSVLHNWRAEIERFRPSLSAHVYHGAKRELEHEADVVLTTYSLLRRDIEALTAVEWDIVVLDESQAIKNPDSQVARAAFQLTSDARIALSGTPVENRLDELWSQLRFLQPGLLGSRRTFGERYVKPIASGDEDRAAHLRRRLKPFLLRRLKSEVAPELPPRTEVELRCELKEPERVIYDSLAAATRNEIVEKLDSGLSVMQALEALLRLRQAACHVGLLPGKEATTSSKVTLLRNTLANTIAAGHKSLVFSQWTSMLDLLEPTLTDAGIEFVRLDGSTRDRAAVVDAFQSTDGPPVMLISLRAGGTGLNLTAADHVCLLDPWWNPAVEDQAADRAHRIGQENPVLVQRFVAANTVEERILKLKARKRALAEAAVGSGAADASLTREDLLELLS